MFRKLAFLCLLLFLGTTFGFGQSVPSGYPAYNWPAVTTTGQVGKYVSTLVPMQYGAYPAKYTVDWTVSGTVPSACTFRIEGSSDGIAWTGLDATAPATDQTPCTSSNMVHFNANPVRYLRVNVVSYTAGDGTTSVVFHYTAGK